MLVLYLQDKSNPGYISYKRLKQAYERKKTDKPLKQIGTDQAEKYVADMKDQIGKALDDDEVRNLATYMITKGLSVKDILPSASNSKTNIIPRD